MRRGLFTFIAFVLGTCFLIPLVQANVQKWAAARGWDQFLINFGGPLMAYLTTIFATRWFALTTSFFIGGAVALWVDYFFRRREKISPQRKLSVAEQQLQLDLRRFVLSPLKDTHDKFLGVIYSVMNTYVGRRMPSSVPIRDAFAEALRHGIQAEFRDLVHAINNDLDRTDSERRAANYFSIYLASQKYIKDLVQISKIEPPADVIHGWLEADLRCLHALRDLQASPLIGPLQNVTEAQFAKSGSWKWN